MQQFSTKPQFRVTTPLKTGLMRRSRCTIEEVCELFIAAMRNRIH